MKLRSVCRRLAPRVVAVVSVAAAALPLAPGRASAYPAATVEIEGHGSGHGLGMGVWGAHGTAVRNPSKPGEEIALRYFPGARLAPWSNEPVRAWLDYDTPFADTVVTAGDPARMPDDGSRYVAPFTVVSATGTTLAVGGRAQGQWPYLRVVMKDGALVLQGASDPAGSPGAWEGPGQTLAAGLQGPVEFRPPAAAQSPAWRGFLQVETTGTWRFYRGSVQSVPGGSSGDEVDTVVVSTVQEYLYGVMAAEGAADRWGPSVDRPAPGREGLRALAIVARTYALNKRAAALATARPYDLCSTSNCQNFRGWGSVGPDGAVVQAEDDRLDAAVNTTVAGGAPEVLVSGDPPQPILAAYASSSGGYSKVGDQPYLAPVADPDDDIAGNPSHTWRVSVPVAAVEAAWPEIGTLQTLQVTERNGLGDMGGRVVTVLVSGSRGTAAASGTDVRGRLGLKSDWFRILTPGGYWIAGADGGIFAFGNAGFHGSAGGLPLVRPVVGMAATPSRDGYWLVASDGGVFAFGDARFRGSTGSIRLAQPVVAMVASRTGNGYWLVASDGGIFAFGDARFFGSTGSIRLAQPVVAMAPTPGGRGYRLVASDGGIFAFGDASFLGSTGGIRLNQQMTGIAATPSGGGYWLVARDGGVFGFGDADFWGSVPLVVPASRSPKVAIEVSRVGF